MADNSITMPLDKGGATDIDPSLLKPGQLQEAEGVAYQMGDPAARKIGGRVSFNSSAPAATAVNGINFNSFDTGTDYVTAQINGTLWGAPTTSGVFISARTGLTASASEIDRTKFADSAFMCNGTDANWVHKSDNTTYPWGLVSQTVAPTGAFVATGITGTFVYWTTEYDSVNDVESANSNATLTQVPANQTVRLTKPATINATATHWRVYRTINTGTYPNGWRVATVLIGTTTYDDTMTDQTLTVQTAYPIVSINDIPEPQNFPPSVFRSVATFEGSLCGVGGRSLYYSETGTPHYFPQSYVINLRPRWGGQARCVRAVNNRLVVLFDNDAFRINTLPKAADSFFDAGVIQEHIANFGTPSPLGACTFSGWGGMEMLFFWDRSGPMITDGAAFDRAVTAIDASIVPAASLPAVECHDNPSRFRIELTYLDTDLKYRRLDFYYDSLRVTQERGFPELAWTGPHLVPGPGTYGLLNGVGVVWTGSRLLNTYGKVYREDAGTTDAANIVDTSGTVNFRLRTGRFYAQGIDSQATASRIYLSKSGTGSQNYSVVLSSWTEGAEQVQTTHSISASTTGASSNDYNRMGQSFDLRVTYDGTVAMPPINNLTCVLDNVGEFVKTNRR